MHRELEVSNFVIDELETPNYGLLITGGASHSFSPIAQVIPGGRASSFSAFPKARRGTQFERTEGSI